jgi:hypothetical protein
MIGGKSVDLKKNGAFLPARWKGEDEQNTARDALPAFGLVSRRSSLLCAIGPMPQQSWLFQPAENNPDG